MKAVFKYSLYPGITECAMPYDALELCVQTQNDQPCLWALVDPLAPTTIKRFFVYGTGQSIHDHDRLRYVGTCQQAGGALVWHVFAIASTPIKGTQP